ncbi:MAG: ATP-binding protein [Methanomicrobiales archaeon]|nr:ATP-binding protein [Methanomicrobiales archaeon]MDI6877438.1 ATP-binding protein [Methanomicrobiales archaeon]
MNLNAIDDEDRTKFRLIGDSVLKYRFTVPYDGRIFVGEVLKITDTVKQLTFFAKVTDLLHESNFQDRKWDTRPYAERFYHLSEDVYLTVEAVPLGYVQDSGTFRKAKTIPTKFSRVEKPSADDFGFLRRVMGEIEVGVMKSGQDVLKEVRVALHAKVMPQHMGVFATTGMGKSNFMKVFCASCMQVRQFGLLIVDPHGEYVAGGRSSSGEPTRGLLHVSAGRDGLSVFTIRDDAYRSKYALSRLYLEHDDFRASDLNLLFDHSDAQRDVVELLDDMRGSELIQFFLSTEFDTFDASAYDGPFPHIARLLRSSHPGTLAVIKRHVSILVRGNPFLRTRGSAIPDILRALEENRVVLIDIPGMGERSELFVLSVITRQIMQRHRSDWGVAEKTRPRQVLITLEEAQRVLGTGGRSTQIFRECAMEGRKFGVGLCVITQQPRNIDPKVLAQVNTFVIMGLGDRGDREILSSSAKQDLSRMDTEIQTLEPGEAVISSLGIPFPVSTRIHLFEDYLQELSRLQKRPIEEGLVRGFGE